MLNVVYIDFTKLVTKCSSELQPVSYKRYFRCNNCFLLLVYTINLSQSKDLVDPPPPADGNLLYETWVSILNKTNKSYHQSFQLVKNRKIPTVPRKWFGSADFDTIYTFIYPSVHNQLIQTISKDGRYLKPLNLLPYIKQSISVILQSRHRYTLKKGVKKTWLFRGHVP